MTKSHRLRSFYDNRDLFLTGLEAGSPRFRVPTWSGSGESPLLGCRLLTSWFIFTWWKGPGSSVRSDPLFEDSTFMTQVPPNAITVDIRISHMNFGGDTSIRILIVSVVLLCFGKE